MGHAHMGRKRNLSRSHGGLLAYQSFNVTLWILQMEKLGETSLALGAQIQQTFMRWFVTMEIVVAVGAGLCWA